MVDLDALYEEYKDLGIDLKPSVARQVLETCRWRWREIPAKGQVGPHQILEIMYSDKTGDKWLSLGRTDLHDNVATTCVGTTNKSFYEDPIKHHIDRTLLGARVTDGGFFVIDSFTDG